MIFIKDVSGNPGELMDSMEEHSGSFSTQLQWTLVECAAAAAAQHATRAIETEILHCSSTYFGATEELGPQTSTTLFRLGMRIESLICIFPPPLHALVSEFESIFFVLNKNCEAWKQSKEKLVFC